MEVGEEGPLGTALKLKPTSLIPKYPYSEGPEFFIGTWSHDRCGDLHLPIPYSSNLLPVLEVLDIHLHHDMKEKHVEVGARGDCHEFSLV